jgi:hypothetical protein
VSFSGLITSASASASRSASALPPRTTWIILNGLFSPLDFGPQESGIVNDPKSMQTEGSEDKHSCAGGVEAGLLGLALTMHECMSKQVTS